MIEEYAALYMLLTLFLLLLAGYPVGFTLGGVSLIFAYFFLDLSDFFLLPQRIFGIVQNITLLAVPLFIFMGVMLERSGLAEDLLESMTALLGKTKAGLAISVVFSGAILAASTGIVGASVVTMGLISLPLMLKKGYSASFSSGIIAASGTLGQIIPPSIVLVLLGDMMGQIASGGEVSVGRLFIASVIPGLLLVSLYFLYAILYCKFNKNLNITTLEIQKKSTKEIISSFFPPAILMIAVLGSIFLGVASPTEAASVGAFGSLIIALLKKKLNLQVLHNVVTKTTELTSMVFMILLGATSFGLVFRLLEGDEVIVNLLNSLELSPAMFLLCVMLLLFILGCFLDFIEIVFIIIPIIAPLALEYEFDLLWFSVLIAVNLQMSFLTPPLGFALFYLKGVAPPEVKTLDIYKGVLPFLLIQGIVLTLIILYPEIVTSFPDWWDEKVVYGDLFSD